MPQLKTQCDAATKAAFGALAASQGTTEAALLREIAVRVLKNAGATELVVPAVDRGGLGKNIHFRLPEPERQAALAIAKADGRTLPGWIRAVVRRVALKGLTFNAAEMNGLRVALNALGALGRNLNTVVHNMQRSGRLDPASIAVKDLTAVVGTVRVEVLNMLDRASNRYEADE